MTDPAGNVELLHRGDPATQQLGIEIVETSADEVTLALQVAPWMLNGHRVLHGGVTFWLGDTAFAYLLAAAGPPSLTRQAEISFLAPVRADARIRAVATFTARTPRSSIVDVRVRDDEGTDVALLRVHGSVIPPER